MDKEKAQNIEHRNSRAKTLSITWDTL